ncbi:MAG: hypothetical protein ACRER1_07290 [Gammaproteobacteria bacterium]
MRFRRIFSSGFSIGLLLIALPATAAHMVSFGTVAGYACGDRKTLNRMNESDDRPVFLRRHPLYCDMDRQGIPTRGENCSGCSEIAPAQLAVIQDEIEYYKAMDEKYRFKGIGMVMNFSAAPSVMTFLVTNERFISGVHEVEYEHAISALFGD